MAKEDFFVTMVSRKRWRRRRYLEEFVIDRYLMVKRGSAFGTHLYATSNIQSHHFIFFSRKVWACEATYARWARWDERRRYVPRP